MDGTAFPRGLSWKERALAGALALGIALLLLVFFSPSWVAFRAWARVPEVFWQVIPVRRGSHVALQVADPFVAIADPLHKIVQWRLLMPLLGHYLGLAAPLVLALAHAGCVLVLAVLVQLGRRRGYGWRECALLALVGGAGAWFFTATGWLGYYDSWLVLGLLAVAWAPRRWVVCLACLLTPWIDERFVLALPLAVLVRWIASAREQSLAALPRWLARELWLPALLVAGYIGLRLWLAGRAGSHTLDEYRRAVEFAQVPAARLAFGSWEGLRAGWIPVLAAMPLLVARRRVLAGSLLAAGVAGTTLAGLASNNDLSRSAALVLPALLLGWEEVRTTALWKRARVAPVLGAVALLLPAHHVVSTFTLPVNRLWHELRLLGDPQPPYAPAAYLEEARAALASGDRARAAEQATIALRLARPQSEIGREAVAVLREAKGRGG